MSGMEHVSVVVQDGFRDRASTGPGPPGVAVTGDCLK